MPAIIFTLAALRNKTPQRLGMGPSFQGFLPLPTKSWSVSGVTKDSTGAALGGCTVNLFRTADNLLIDSTVSDGSGNYSFTTLGPGELYYCVAYKPGAPDVAGTTVNTVAGS